MRTYTQTYSLRTNIKGSKLTEGVKKKEKERRRVKKKKK